MLYHSDHWIARNFATNHSSTRANMKNLVIPGWNKKLNEWEETLIEFQKDPTGIEDIILTVQRWIREVKENIRIAEERLASS